MMPINHDVYRSKMKGGFGSTESDISDERSYNTTDLMEHRIYSLIKEKALTLTEIAQSLSLERTEIYSLLTVLQNKRLIMASSKIPVKFISCKHS